MEAYAGAILGAWICLLIFYPKYRSKTLYLSIIGLTIGILLSASPLIVLSKWTRWTFLEGRMIMVYPYLGLSVVFLLVSILYRRVAIEPVNLVLLEISIASAIMTVYFKTGARVDGLGVICSAIGICRLIGTVKSTQSTQAPIPSYVILFLLAVHLIGVDVMCYRLRQEYDNIIRRYLNHEQTPIFADITLRRDAPFWLLQKPYYDWWAHGSTMYVLNSVYGRPGDDLRVVPSILQTFNIRDGIRIPGVDHLYIFNEYMVSTKDLGGSLIVDFGLGAKERWFYRVPFHTYMDTVDYIWYHPDNTQVDYLINPIPVRVSTQ